MRNQDEVLKQVEEAIRRQAEAEIVWLDGPPTPWQVFEKHAWHVVVGVLVGSGLLYFAALLRAL